MVLRRSRAHVPEVLLCQVDLLSELHFTECSEIFISLKALQRYEQTCIHRCHHCSFYRVMKFSQLQFVHLKLLQQNNVNSSFLLILPPSTTHLPHPSPNFREFKDTEFCPSRFYQALPFLNPLGNGNKFKNANKGSN